MVAYILDPSYKDKGSFRDPSGSVYIFQDCVLRTVNKNAEVSYEAIRTNKFIVDAIDRGDLISFQELNPSDFIQDQFPKVSYVIRHPKLDYISYPYEWSFSLLKAAAIHHLNLQLNLLENDIVLSDATAYNIQFVGHRPIFIDFLSLRPYQKGEYWTGYRQFCEQFLNPLLFSSITKIDHNHWYRGSLEGISSRDLINLIPFTKISWNIFIHVILQARLEQKNINKSIEHKKVKICSFFSKNAYYGMLCNLRNWVANLSPPLVKNTIWKDYASNNTYKTQEIELKRQFIQTFIETVKPKKLLDIGCNTGDYSILAIETGVEYVVGFDSDHAAIEQACLRARVQNLPFLPLILDASNPSPNQGWDQCERLGFMERAKADALLMLAFQHHLRMKNITLAQIVAWFIRMAPCGVVEFVPKTDVTVQNMLSLRQDIFTDYDINNFEKHLTDVAKIVNKKIISESGRCLFWYERYAK